MPGKSNGSHSVENEWARAPPKVSSFWVRCGRIFYNPEENSCFGRTPKRWAIVLTFYAIFYAVLAALFAVCMAGLFYTLENDKPAYTLSRSLIGENPGVTYRPIPDAGFGFTLHYHTRNKTEFQPYIQQLQDFRQMYKDEEWLTAQNNCSIDDNFGYPDAPCFFVKINKIYGWSPEFYDASDLPSDMSGDLQQFIKELPADEQKQVWVSCWQEHKENSSDIQFEYPWGRGLPASFYPYINGDGYRSPMVAVKITPPVGRMVVIRCRAWAKNIIYNKSIKEASGYARIQIYVEADNTTDIVTSGGLDM